MNVTHSGMNSTTAENLIRMLLDAVLQQVRLPFSSLNADFFLLNLLRGPEVEDDQAKLYGDIV